MTVINLTKQTEINWLAPIKSFISHNFSAILIAVGALSWSNVEAITSKVDVNLIDQNGEIRQSVSQAESAFSLGVKAYVKCEEGFGSGSYVFRLNVIGPKGNIIESFSSPSGSLPDSGNHIIEYKFADALKVIKLTETGGYRVKATFDEKYPQYPSTLSQNGEKNFSVSASSAKDTLASWQVKLLSPAHRSVLTNPRPFFQWIPSTAAKKYNVYLSERADDPRLAPLWKAEGVVNTLIQYPNDVNLLVRGKKYYWQVVGFDQAGRQVGGATGGSEIFEFTLGWDDARKITLLSPVSDTEVRQDLFEFEWVELRGTEKYKIQLSDNKDFSQISNIVWEGVSEIGKMPYPLNASSLVMSKVYYWRVVVDNDGFGVPIVSETGSFRYMVDHTPNVVVPPLPDGSAGIRGKIYDQFGKPVLAAAVTVSGPLGDTVRYTERNIGSDKDGKYEIALVYGRYSVAVAKTGYKPARIEITVKEKEVIQHDFSLVSDRKIFNGQVVNAITGAGIANAKVTLKNLLYDVEAKSDEQGNFSFSNLRDGSYTAEVSQAPFFVTQVLSLSFTSTLNTQKIYLQPNGKGTITGYVFDSTLNKPIGFADITLKNIAPESENADGITDASPRIYNMGRFEQTNLKAGLYEVTVKTPYMPAQTKKVMVQGGGVTDTEFRFDGNQVRVSGIVLRPDKSPVFNAQVTFPGYPGLNSCLSDTAGKFDCSVYPGKYELKLQYPGFEAYTQNIDIVENKDIGQIILRQAVLEVKLSVTSTSGVPLNGITADLVFGGKTLKVESDIYGNLPSFTAGEWSEVSVAFRDPAGIFESQTQKIRVTQTDAAAPYRFSLRRLNAIKGIVQNQSREPLANATVWLPGSGYEVMSGPDGKFTLQLPEILPTPDSIDIYVKRPDYFTEKRTILTDLIGQEVIIRLRSEKEKATSFTSVRLNNSVREIRTELDDVEAWIKRTVAKIIEDLEETRKAMLAYKKVIDEKTKRINEIKQQLIIEMEKPYVSGNALRLSVELKAINAETKLLTEAMSAKVLAQLDSIERFINLFKRAVELRLPVIDIKLEDLMDSVIQSPFLDEEARTILRASAQELRVRFETEVKEFYRVKSIEIDELFARISGEIKGTLFEIVDIQNKNTALVDEFVARIEKDIEQKLNAEKNRVPQVVSVLPDSGIRVSPSQQIVVRFDKSIDTSSLVIEGNWQSYALLIWSTENRQDDTLKIMPSPSWPLGRGVFKISAKDTYGNLVKYAVAEKPNSDEISFSYIAVPREEAQQQIEVDDRPANLPETPAQCPPFATDCVDLSNQQELKLAQKISEIQGEAMAIRNKLLQGVNEVESMQVMLKEFYRRAAIVDANMSKLAEAIRRLDGSTTNLIAQIKNVKEYIQNWEYSFELREIGGFKVKLSLFRNQAAPKKLDILGNIIIDSEVLGDGWKIEIPKYSFDLSEVMDEQLLEFRSILYGSHQYLREASKEEELWRLVSEYNNSAVRDLFPRSLIDFDGGFLPPNLKNPGNFSDFIPEPLRKFDAQKIFSANVTEFNISSLSAHEKETILKSASYDYAYNALTPFLKQVVPDTRQKLDDLREDFLIKKYLPQDLQQIYNTAKSGDGDALMALFATYLPRDIIDAYEQSTGQRLNPELLHKANLDNQAATDFVRLFLPEKLRQALPVNFFAMSWQDIAPDLIKNFDPVEMTEKAKIKFMETVLEKAQVDGELNFKFFVLRNIKLGYITKEKARSTPEFANYEKQSFFKADTSLDFGGAGTWEWGATNLPKVEVGSVYYFGKGDTSADEVSVTLPRPMGPVFAGFGLELSSFRHSLKKKWFSFTGVLHLGMSKGSSDAKKIQLQELRLEKNRSDKYEVVKLGLNLQPPVDMFGMQLSSFTYDKPQKLFDFGGKLVSLGGEKEGWSFELSRIWFQNGNFAGAEASNIKVEMGSDRMLQFTINKISIEFVSEGFEKHYFLQVSEAALEIKAQAPDLETRISIAKLDVKWYKSQKPDIQFENLTFGLPTLDLGILRITLTKIVLSYKMIEGQKRYEARISVKIEVPVSGGGDNGGYIQPTILFVEGKKPEFLAFELKIQVAGVKIMGMLQNKPQYFYARLRTESVFGAFEGEYYNEYKSKDWFASVMIEAKTPCIPVFSIVLADISICGGGLKYGSRGGSVVIGGTLVTSLTSGATLEYFRGTIQVTYIAGEKLIQFSGQGEVLPFIEENTGLKLGKGFFEIAISMNEPKYIDLFAQFNMPSVMGITPKFMANLDFYLDKNYVTAGIGAGMMAQQEFQGGGGGLKLGVNIGARSGLKFKKKAPTNLPIMYKGVSYRPPPTITAGYVLYLDAYASLQLNKLFKVPGFRGGITAMAQVIVAYDYGEPQFGAGLYFYVAGSASLFGVGASLAVALDAGGQVGKSSMYVSAGMAVSACVMVASASKCFNGEARITLGKPPFDIPKKIPMCEPVPAARMNVFVSDKFGVPLKNARVKLTPKNSDIMKLTKGEGECGAEYKSGMERFLEDPGAAIQAQLDADIEKAKKIMGDLGNSGEKLKACQAKIQQEIKKQAADFKTGIDSIGQDMLAKTDVKAQMKQVQRNLQTKVKELEGSLKERFSKLDQQMAGQLKAEIEAKAQACINHVKDKSNELGDTSTKDKEQEEDPCDIDLEAMIAGAEGEGNYADKFVKGKIDESKQEIDGLVSSAVTDFEKVFDVQAAFKQAEDAVKAQIDTAVAGVQAQVDQCIADMTSGVKELNTIAAEYAADPLARVIQGGGKPGEASEDNPFEGVVNPNGRWRSGPIPLYEKYTIEVEDESGLYAMDRIFNEHGGSGGDNAMSLTTGSGSSGTFDDGGVDVSSNEEAKTFSFTVAEQGIKVMMGPGELVRDVVVHVTDNQGNLLGSKDRAEVVTVYLVNNDTGANLREKTFRGGAEKAQTRQATESQGSAFNSVFTQAQNLCNNVQRDDDPTKPRDTSCDGPGSNQTSASTGTSSHTNGDFAYFPQVFGDWNVTVRAVPNQGSQYGQSTPMTAKVKAMPGFQGKKKVAYVKIALPAGKTFWEGKVLSDGKPVPDAKVTLDPAPSSKNPDITFKDGTFYFNGLTVGQSYSAKVEVPNFEAHTETIRVMGSNPISKDIYLDRKVSEIAVQVKGPTGASVSGSIYKLVRDDKPSERIADFRSGSSGKMNLAEGFTYTMKPDKTTVIDLKTTGNAKLEATDRGIIRIDYKKGGNFQMEITEQGGPALCFSLSAESGEPIELNQNELKLKVGNAPLPEFALLRSAAIPQSLKSGSCASANHAVYLSEEYMPNAASFNITAIVEKTGMSKTEMTKTFTKSSTGTSLDDMKYSLGEIKLKSSKAPADNLRGREIMAGKFKFVIGKDVQEVPETANQIRRTYKVNGVIHPIGTEVKNTADVENLKVEAWFDTNGEFKYEVKTSEVCSQNCSSQVAKVTANNMSFSLAGIKARLNQPTFKLMSGEVQSALSLTLDSSTSIPQLKATTPVEIAIADQNSLKVDSKGKPEPNIAGDNSVALQITGGGDKIQTSDGVPVQLKKEGGMVIQRTSGSYVITFHGTLLYDGQPAGEVKVSYDMGNTLTLSPQNAKDIVLTPREFSYHGAPTRIVSTAFTPGMSSPDWNLEVGVYDEKSKSYSRDRAVRIRKVRFENGKPVVLDRSQCEAIEVKDGGNIKVTAENKTIDIKKENLKGEWYTNINKCVFSGEGVMQ